MYVLKWYLNEHDSKNKIEYTKCKYSSLVIYESIWILTAQTDYIYVPK